jgi:hypothetical protein
MWKGRSKGETGAVENRDTWVINTGVDVSRQVICPFLLG